MTIGSVTMAVSVFRNSIIFSWCIRIGDSTETISTMFSVVFLKTSRWAIQQNRGRPPCLVSGIDVVSFSSSLTVNSSSM